MSSFNAGVNHHMGSVSNDLHSACMEVDKQWKTYDLLVSMQCLMFSNYN